MKLDYKSLLQRLIKEGIKGLIYPAYCIFCQEPLLGEEFKTLCSGCLQLIEEIPPETRCPRCFQLECLSGNRCRVKKHYCRHVFALYECEGVTENLLQTFKIEGRSYLSQGLGALMTLAWINQGLPFPDLIVPIPSSPLTSFKRGFQPSVLLAETIAILMNRPLWRGLKKELSFLKQAHLNEKERTQGEGAQIYLIKDPLELEDKSILLIDDLITTGNTLRQASTELLKGYPRFIDGLVLLNKSLSTEV